MKQNSGVITIDSDDEDPGKNVFHQNICELAFLTLHSEIFPFASSSILTAFHFFVFVHPPPIINHEICIKLPDNLAALNRSTTVVQTQRSLCFSLANRLPLGDKDRTAVREEAKITLPDEHIVFGWPVPMVNEWVSHLLNNLLIKSLFCFWFAQSSTADNQTSQTTLSPKQVS